MANEFETHRLGKVIIPEVIPGLERITDLGRLTGTLISENGFTSPVLVTNDGEFISANVYTTNGTGQREYDSKSVRNVSFLAHPEIAEAVAKQEGWFYFAPGEVQTFGDEEGKSVRKISGSVLLGAVDAIIRNAVEHAKFKASTQRYDFEKKEQEVFAEVQRQTGRSLKELLGFFADHKEIRLEGKVGHSDFYIVGTPKITPELSYHFDTTMALELGRPGSDKHASPLSITQINFLRKVMPYLVSSDVKFKKGEVESILSAASDLVDARYAVSEEKRRTANLNFHSHGEYDGENVLVKGDFRYYNRDLGGIPAQSMRYLRTARDMFGALSAAVYAGLDLLGKQKVKERDGRVKELKSAIGAALRKK